MIKKIWLSLLILFAISFAWVTFANPIVMDMPDVCYKLENVEVDNYRVIISSKSPQKENTSKTKDSYYGVVTSSIDESSLVNNKRVWRFYLPKMGECIQEFSISSSDEHNRDRWRGSFNVVLIDNSIDVDTLTEEEFNNNAIFVWQIWISDCLYDYDCDVINTYKVVNSWDNYNLVLDKRENVERKHNIKGKTTKFPLFWWLAVLIETLVLFFIAKIFWKEDEISKKKLLLRWIIPTTVTLPLLWFVLPLIIWDGTLYIIIWETLVTSIEAIMIRYWLNISRKRAIIASIICNLLSFVFLSLNIFWDLDSIIVIIWLLMFIFIEGIILFLIWKLLKEWISSKKLVLCWVATPIVEIILAIFIVRLFQSLYRYLDAYPYLPWIVSMIAVKLLVDMIIIKSFRKIWRWKIIITSISFNICVSAIIFALIYLIGGL